MRRPYAWAALAGIVAVALVAVTTEAVSAVLSPSLSPLGAVGSAVVDAVPAGLRDLVISLAGTADKAVLWICLAAVIAALAVVAGIAELRRRYAGGLIIVVFIAVGVVAMLTGGQFTVSALASPVAGAVVGVAVLRALTRRLQGWRLQQAGWEVPLTRPARPEGAMDRGFGRRNFLRLLGTGAAVAVVAGGLTAIARGGQRAVSGVRTALKLPKPASEAAPVPAAASLDIDGITPLITANQDFYRIDTALIVPRVTPQDWTLSVTGMVDRPMTLTFDELLAQPMRERYITLACVSNPVGGHLVGNAKWLGWPVRELLARAGPSPAADMVLSTSDDGWTAGTPLGVLTDRRDALLAVGMNDEPLPFEHGFPVRLVVPGLYGYVSATKWVTELKVTRFADETAYWTDRGWAPRGPIKTASRIDTPRNGAEVDAGAGADGDEVQFAGVAWAQHRGISAVQIRADDGPWHEARLARSISADTWCQWAGRLPLAAGDHAIAVRAVDGTGEVQTGRIAPTVPDGATGYHTIHITVSGA